MGRKRNNKITYYPLVFAENYYISIEGYVFYLDHKIKLLPYIKNQTILVDILNKPYSLLNLMLEYFFSGWNMDASKYSYTQDKRKPLRIPKRLIVHLKLDDNKSEDYFNSIYEQKAASSNKRAKDKITGLDVSRVVKKDDRSCVYCGIKVKNNKWHLDHIKPLSKGGMNVFENLCVSCKTCNLMKNSMLKKDFVKKCEHIYKKQQED